MVKKSIFYIFGLVFITILCACSFFEKNEEYFVPTENWIPQMSLPRKVVVCRQKECAPASLSMSSEYVYNSLLHLLDNNNQSKVLPCMADPKTRVCTEPYVAMLLTVGVTPAYMYINDVRISDISNAVNRKTIDLILNYNVTFNGQTPLCKPAKTLLYVKNLHNIIMEDAGYLCKMTTVGSSTIKTLFAIDYIDLDYGYIGGYYSIGVSGPAFGGGSGYMLLRLPKSAYPLAPELMEPSPEPRSMPAVRFDEQPQSVAQNKETFKEKGEIKEEVKEEEIVEEPANIQAAPVAMPKIKVTVKTKTKANASSQNLPQDCTEGEECSTEEIVTTEDVPEVNVEYTDYNGVKVFPFVKPRVKVTTQEIVEKAKEPKVEIVDDDSTKPQNPMAPAKNDLEDNNKDKDKAEVSK